MMLSDVCLQRTSGLNREQRGIGRLKLAQRQPTLHATRTPLSRSKGQGHQAALITAVLARQAAAAASVGTYWPWEPTAMLSSAGAVGSAAPTEGREGRGHIVAAAHLQLVFMTTELQLHYKSPYATRCITLYIMQRLTEIRKHKRRL